MGTALAYGLPPQINATWEPLPGSQTAFLACPVKEILYEGTRGPGKTEAIGVKFQMYTGKGFGPRWAGVIFRKRSKDLDDVERKLNTLYAKCAIKPRYLRAKSDRKWIWPDGEELMLRHTEKPEQYEGFHGWELPFVCWEELTSWPTMDLYDAFKSVCRSSIPEMPRFYLSTSNPFGRGHAWVKEYWIDPYPGKVGPTGVGIKDPETGEIRVRIRGDIRENPYLWKNDPQYIKALQSIRDDNRRKAWLDGDWTITFGGFLDGYWDAEKHIHKPFTPPVTWKHWYAMDWGFAKPYSIGFYAMDPDGKVYRYDEMYGYGGKANVGSREYAKSVAKKLKEKIERAEKDGVEFRRNPADSAIWHGIGTEQTVQQEFRKEKVPFVKSIKGPNSRVNGADIVRRMLAEETFVVTSNCKHWIRTVPGIMPDDSNPEDVDTDMEDHCWDETRYSLVSRHLKPVKKEKKEGPKPGTFDHLVQATKDTKRPRNMVYRGHSNSGFS